VRLRMSVHGRVEVPLWRCFPPRVEGNCVLATGRGEQLETKGQSVELTGDKPATQTRYGLMRLTRLRAKSEVRRTADSDRKRIGGQARPEHEASPEDGGAWGGWRRNVWKCMFGNQGDLSWRWKEQGRSQSPRSSCEAGNDRGAKGGRKVEA
jgi:hypothetical protein